jgi:hypothetical protein
LFSVFLLIYLLEFHLKILLMFFSYFHPIFNNFKIKILNKNKNFKL